MPDFKFECDNEETLNYLKAKTIKCKVILLDSWKEDPLSNPSFFQKRKKDKFTKELYEMFTTLEDSKIDEEFNAIVNDGILYNGAELEKIYVHETTQPDYSVLQPPPKEDSLSTNEDLETQEESESVVE
jgi:hypothetical protein